MKFKKPTLLLDKQKCLANMRRMNAKAEQHGLTFRPHFKTHQSAEVGQWFREMGVSKICVSSVSMAKYFADHAWDDITIALPVNPAEIDDIDQLAAKINLNVLIENAEALEFLDKNLTNEIGVFIKIDAGYHRTGIAIQNHQAILKLVRYISTKSLLNFCGFIIHNGHTYHASGSAEVLSIHNRSVKDLVDLKRFMLMNEVDAVYSIGDTPSMSQTENFDQIDEIRPGNFVFYDVMQQSLGVCRYQDIALALVCPIVAKHESRKEIVIYGGAIHFSKDYILDKNGKKIFGKVVELSKTGWGSPIGDTFVKSLSQEHGVIKASQDFFEKVNIGDFIGVLPIHSCLTVHAMREMFLPNGERITTINS